MVPKMIDDRYELFEVLASGGMATVWEALDTRLNRRVAIKRPHPTAPDDPERKRLVREARAAASISHPNLVSVYDVGEDAEGPYMVMELVDAPTLAEVDLSPNEMVEVASQIAEALAVVHNAGIVHRDIKPANILMPDSGPQLTDFGIAIDPQSTSTLTLPGTILTTPQYAAPEILAGDPPSHKSDIFSLAVVVYEGLSGEPPFDGTDRSTPASLDDPHLDRVLKQALSSDPEDRPDAETFAAQLKGSSPTVVLEAGATAPTHEGSTIPMAPILVSSAVQPEIPENSGRGRRWWTRVAALAAVLLLVIIAAAFDREGAVPVAETTTTIAATSTSLATTTSTSTSTTISEVTVVSVRKDLENILNGVGPPQLKPKDQKDILKKVDDAIEGSEKGEDDDEVAKHLQDAWEDIDAKLDDGEPKDEALQKIAELAELLGVVIDAGEDE
jgi:serine/threonine-protein kinase